jgi:hypothetical protein
VRSASMPPSLNSSIHKRTTRSLRNRIAQTQARGIPVSNIRIAIKWTKLRLLGAAYIASRSSSTEAFSGLASASGVRNKMGDPHQCQAHKLKMRFFGN